MTKRFAIQCLLNGIEADMISELFTILEGFPCGVRDQDGNVRLSVPACDYEKVRRTASYFATKFEGLEDKQEGLVEKRDVVNLVEGVKHMYESSCQRSEAAPLVPLLDKIKAMPCIMED